MSPVTYTDLTAHRCHTLHPDIKEWVLTKNLDFFHTVIHQCDRLQINKKRVLEYIYSVKGLSYDVVYEINQHVKGSRSQKMSEPDIIDKCLKISLYHRDKKLMRFSIDFILANDGILELYSDADLHLVCMCKLLEYEIPKDFYSRKEISNYIVENRVRINREIRDVIKREFCKGNYTVLVPNNHGGLVKVLRRD